MNDTKNLVVCLGLSVALNRKTISHKSNVFKHNAYKIQSFQIISLVYLALCALLMQIRNDFRASSYIAQKCPETSELDNVAEWLTQSA